MDVVRIVDKDIIYHLMKKCQYMKFLFISSNQYSCFVVCILFSQAIVGDINKSGTA